MKLNLKSQTADDLRVERREFKKFTLQNIHAVDFTIAIVYDVKNSLPRYVYSDKAARLDCLTIIERYKAEGLSFITQRLPQLMAALLSNLEGNVVPYTGFTLCKQGRPVLFGPLFKQILLHMEHDTDCIRGLYQILVAFSKFRGPYPKAVLGEQLSDFVKVDEELGMIDLFQPDTLAILNQARAITHEICKSFSMSDRRIVPRPGPGATNTKVANNMRYRPHVVYGDIEKHIDWVSFFTVNPVDAIQQTKVFRDAFLVKHCVATARFKFVFKKYMKARGICIEENDVQFLQQAIKNWFYEVIPTHVSTQGCIDFRDQSINQLLALKSSETLEHATIDESEASDRISRSLVSWLHQDNFELHQVLMALSTKLIVLPRELICDDGELTLVSHKFAPMGSGLCFPIMTLAHWALVKSILFLHGDSPDEKVYVYGDDIVIPSRHMEIVLRYLPLFGMKINSDKSFYKSFFRESCGTHAYKGKDITPVYIKYIPNSTSIQAAMSCIAAEFQFHSAGYTLTAGLFREHLQMHFKDLPVVSEFSPIFGFKRKGNFFPVTFKRVTRKKGKWGEPTFRFRTVVPRSISAEPPTEFERYLRHVLTKDHVSEVGERPDDFTIVWRDLHLSQVLGIHNPYNITDDRSEADVTQEKKYDFNLMDKRQFFGSIYTIKSVDADHLQWLNFCLGFELCPNQVHHFDHVYKAYTMRCGVFVRTSARAFNPIQPKRQGVRCYTPGLRWLRR